MVRRINFPLKNIITRFFNKMKFKRTILKSIKTLKIVLHKTQIKHNIYPFKVYITCLGVKKQSNNITRNYEEIYERLV